MIINKIKSPIINKKETTVKEDRSVKSQKSKLKDTGKKILLTLSCLAAAGYFLIHNKKNENIINNTKESNDPKEPSDDTTGENKNSISIYNQATSSEDSANNVSAIDDSIDDDPEDEINPGYDGLTKVVLAIGIDGNIYELYQLSDGRLISPADYHFPGGRSINQLAFEYHGRDNKYLTIIMPGSKSVTQSYGGNNLGNEDISSFDDETVYKELILSELGKLDSSQEILNELYKPENKDLYDFLFSIKHISSPVLKTIRNKWITQEDVLYIIQKRLSAYKEKTKNTDADINLQFIENLQTIIQEKMKSIQMLSAEEQQAEEYFEEEDYYEDEEIDENYLFC